MYENILEAAAFLKKQGIQNPEIGIVLGTGLGKIIQDIKINRTIEYREIPHFPESTVESHAGKLIYGTLEGKKVLAMQGRLHYYEGYPLSKVTFPIRVMRKLGIKKLLLSNACGALNPEIKKSELMLMTDHINLLPDNPLIGKNIDKMGPRFPDMSEPYNPTLNGMLIQIADRQNIKLHKGVYVAVSGPNLETKAEYRYLRKIGADVVGMSTVPEAIVANHMGLPCAAISVITDECNPDDLEPVNIAEILEAASIAEDKLITIFKELVKTL